MIRAETDVKNSQKGGQPMMDAYADFSQSVII